MNNRVNLVIIPLKKPLVILKLQNRNSAELVIVNSKIPPTYILRYWLTNVNRKLKITDFFFMARKKYSLFREVFQIAFHALTLRA